MRELRLSVPFVGGVTAVYTKEEVKQNITTISRHARLAFVFGPIVAAVYICRGTAKAARALEHGAKRAADKLEAADQSLSVKAKEVHEDILDIEGIEELPWFYKE